MPAARHFYSERALPPWHGAMRLHIFQHVQKRLRHLKGHIRLLPGLSFDQSGRKAVLALALIFLSFRPSMPAIVAFNK